MKRLYVRSSGNFDDEHNNVMLNLCRLLQGVNVVTEKEFRDSLGYKRTVLALDVDTQEAYDILIALNDKLFIVNRDNDISGVYAAITSIEREFGTPLETPLEHDDSLQYLGGR